MAQPRQRRRKCLCCRAWFMPDPRKRGQQRYCSDEQCRKASKAASQQRWARKADNESYFHGPEHVDRVRRWRRAHPRYWRKKLAPEVLALQDLIDMQPIEAAGKSGAVNRALQDLMATLPRRRLQRPARPLGTGAQRVGQPSSATYRQR
jgi:hypothetical protein